MAYTPEEREMRSENIINITCVESAYSFIDLRGNIYNNYKVLDILASPPIREKNHTYWFCECLLCGNKKYVEAYDLKKGKFKSCGCLQYQTRANPIYKHRLYGIHQSMINRCYKEKNKSFKNYGARGITICDEWLVKKQGYINFYNWSMQNGHEDHLTVDRINTDGNYEPSNCKWSTWDEQENNRTNNYIITINDRSQNVMQWAKEYNLPDETIWSRIRRGKTGNDLIKPSRYKAKNNSNKNGGK